jgi:hypothetical protein
MATLKTTLCKLCTSVELAFSHSTYLWACEAILCLVETKIVCLWVAIIFISKLRLSILNHLDCYILSLFPLRHGKWWACKLHEGLPISHHCDVILIVFDRFSNYEHFFPKEASFQYPSSGASVYQQHLSLTWASTNHCVW